MPEGSGYAGTVEDFTKAHQDVVGAKEAVEGELKQVWDAVAGLQALWKGAAATAFTTMMERFDANSKKLNTALEGIAEQLKASGSQYEESEVSQQDVFGSLSQQLDG
jgi:WXG100 family type VII secretion target